MRIRLAVWLGISAYTAGTGFAQGGAAAESATLQSLLAEVRQLRSTLERTLVVWPQMQLLLQRMQMQQQHVDTISRQLEQVRDQRGRLASEQGSIAAEVKRSEARLNEEQDPRRRRELEDNLRRMKSILEDQATRDQQQQARESQLAGQVQNEQAKLMEFSDRLDSLERTLQAALPAK